MNSTRLTSNIKDSGIRFEMSSKHREFLLQQKYKFGFPESRFGEIVYYRTYSRMKEDGSQENWHDTVIRVIDGLFTIRKWWFSLHNLPWKEELAQNRAVQMATNMLQMKWLPPGRGLWIMGTDYIYERGGMALYNCAFVEIEDLEKDCSWLMDALMCGCGVGFGISDKPQTLSKPSGQYQSTYTIPDSREGWVESIRHLIKSYLDIERKIEWAFNYDEIRKYGEPIKGFGGTSSGPEPLRMLPSRSLITIPLKGAIRTSGLKSRF